MTKLFLSPANASNSHLRNLVKLLIKRIPVVTIGFSLGLIFSSNSAYALNGFSYTSSCAGCKATSDFVTAAEAAAYAQGQSGLYTLVSTTNPETAYIQIIGHIKFTPGKDGPNPFIITAATPVDASGNSLAGASEASQEQSYAAIDVSLFGGSRNNSTGIPATGVTVPDDYAGSFINSTDEEVVPGIGAGILNLGINPAEIPVGTTITVNFSDGTSAQYIKISSIASYQWQWNGVAYTSKANGHKLMNRDGSLKNPNTSGIGGGSPTAPGFGPSSSLAWVLNNQFSCNLSVTIDLGDGPEFVGGLVVPC